MSALRAAAALAAAAAIVAGSAPAAGEDVRAWRDRCNPAREHSPKSRPLWWYRCADGDTIIVFVHGGASDNLEEWQNTEALGFVDGRLAQKALWIRWPLTGKNDYWPWQVAEDPRFDGASIALAGYMTGLFTGLYGVDDAAEEWFAYLRTPHPATGRAVLDYRRILFVAHSAGGVIARYVLAKYPGAFGGKRAALLLMASGGVGTQLFDELPGAAVNVLLLYRLGWQLRSGSEFLGQLDACFRRVRDDPARGFELAGREIAETKRYGAEVCDGAGKLGLGYIVTPAQAIYHFRSGDPLTGLPSLALETVVDGSPACFDHETLVRPSADRREPHALLAEFYTRAIVERGRPAGDDTATWERLPASVVGADEQQERIVAAGREAWRNPLECR